jgi:hypothetical protein
MQPILTAILTRQKEFKGPKIKGSFKENMATLTWHIGA